MVECSHSDNEYLHYKCYNRLYRYFTNDSIFPNNGEELKIISPNIDINSYHKKEQKQIFNKLYQYLRGDGIFLKQNETECCKYINYWLNKTVRNLIPELYDNDSFKIFRGIVDFYNEKINQSINKRCVSDIKYIEPHELNKMRTLYSLYNNYALLIAELKGYDYDSCKILTDMYLNYNDALVSSYNKDDKLFSRLENLKKLLDVIPSKEKEKCESYIQFKDPESIKKTTKKESEHQTRTHDQTMITSELPHQEPELPPPEAESQSQERDSPAQPLLQPVTSELPESYFRGISSPPGRNALEETNRGLPQTAYNRNSEIHGLKPVSDHTVGLLYSDELGNSFIPENVGSEKLGRQHSEDGFLGKVQGAFSTIVQNVDPAPVLGVSGGMGVLFILFKYTPVGSFFGGRRGRFRQIPRTFGGFPPGYFGNFQEYDGGLIGYSPMSISSLAE